MPVSLTQRTDPKHEFTHIVLTRFNVEVEYAAPARGIDSQWLQERLALFTQYCLPAVAGQQDADFKWLVFCNAASPEWFKEEMGSFAEYFTAIYLEGVSTDQIIAKKVRESGYVTAPYLITTRIDNDDAMAKSHLALVQAAFRRQHRQFLLFPWGLQSFRGYLYQVYWTANPFLSLIERVPLGGEITTVLCAPHTEVRRSGNVCKLWRTAQWLQVIHGDNVGNSLRGWPATSSRSHSNFDVEWPQEVSADRLSRRLGFFLSYVFNRACRVLGRLSQKAEGILRLRQRKHAEVPANSHRLRSGIGTEP